MRGSGTRVSIRAVVLVSTLWALCPAAVRPQPPGGTAVVYASQVTIETYNYAGYLRSAYSSTYNMNYPVLDWDDYFANRSHSPRIYDTVVLENDYLVATVIPALGGRVYSLVFKPTGSNAFYSNQVIKPTHWGPTEQGWWLAAGGMEWCLPVDEHGYEWGIPWTVEDRRTDAAGAYVTLSDTSATDRLRARITLFLPHDAAYLGVTPRIENPASQGFWFKYWTNVQVAPGPDNTLSPDLRFVLPTSEVTIHSTGDDRVPGPGNAMSWPWYRGLDWSRLGTWNEWIGFFARPAASRDFQGVYDSSVNEGLARVYPSAFVRGAKGFAWGWNEKYPSYHWTNDRTYYAEVHGGVAPTFWDSAYLPPGGVLEWTEWWYPIAGTGGLTTAAIDAALNLAVSGTQVLVGAQPTAAQPGGQLLLWRPGEAAPLHRAAVSLSPGTPYQATLAPGGDLSGLVLVYLDGARDLLATIEPTPETEPPTARVDDLPPYVTAPGDLLVSWSGSDRHSCVIEYDVQVRDGYGGAWTDWLTRTVAVSATYPSGVDGHTYFFRARALDLYGNLGGYSDDEWGQAFSSVLLTPQPVLVTSRKQAGRWSAVGGDVVTYTLSVRNTGSADAASVILTDTVPAPLVLLTDTVQAATGVVSTTVDRVRWQGGVGAGQQVEVVYGAQVSPSVTVDLHPVTNTMRLAYGGATIERRGWFWLGHSNHFPLVARDGWP